MSITRMRDTRHRPLHSRKLRAMLMRDLEQAAEKLRERHMELGTRLRRARDTRGKKQREVARAVGVDTQTVSRWERGINEPDLEKLQLVANFLDWHIADLLTDLPGGAESEPTPPLLHVLLQSLSSDIAELQAGSARIADELRKARRDVQKLRTDVLGRLARLESDAESDDADPPEQRTSL
jgi:transcriptional regulator with XRE-family HTH domain